MKNVYCHVIFYDSQGVPIDVDVVRFRGMIPAGLAKRLTSRVKDSVRKLATEPKMVSPQEIFKRAMEKGEPEGPRKRIEFRILDFELAN